MRQREQRIAANEVRFREINERLRGSLDGFVDDSEMVDFVCECGNADCSGVVSLQVGEYEGVRGDGTHFVTIPGHEALDVETVIQRQDRFQVVEKDPPAQPYVRRHDPRAPH
jgi:hypothetical protein